MTRTVESWRMNAGLSGSLPRPLPGPQVRVTAQQTSAPAPALRPRTAKTAQAPLRHAIRQGQAKPETHITPDQAKQLFSWSTSCSNSPPHETGLPIKSEVKRQLTTRAAVESYLNEKFNEDEDAKRMQRSEIVLKKFGLLDRDFDLKPFLLVAAQRADRGLLRPQIQDREPARLGQHRRTKARAGPRADPRPAGPARRPGQMERPDATRCLTQLRRRHRPSGQGRARHRPRSRHRGPGHGRHDGQHPQADGPQPAQRS